MLASGTGEAGSLVINQDARVLGAAIRAGETLTYTLPEGRYGYMVVADGEVTLNGKLLRTRDGAAISGGETLTLEGVNPAELVLVDTV